MLGETLVGHAELPFYLPVASYRAGKVLFAAHNGLMHCGFADGHVKAYHPEATAWPGNLWFNTKPAAATNRRYLLRLRATALAFRPA